MDEVTKGRLRGELSDKQYAERIESIKRFERQLTDNGYLVLKLFFQIGKKEQKKRLEELEGNKDTAWRVGENDWYRVSIMTNARKSSINISPTPMLP